MLDIRKRTGVLFVVAMVAQIILVSAQVQSRNGVRVLSLVTFEVFSRVERAAFGVIGGTRGIWVNYVALRGVRSENDALRRQVADLEIQLQGQRALAARSAQLQALMDLKSHATFPTLAAEVIGGNPNPDMRTITIDRGSVDGVLADMAIIAPAGVVGRVIGPAGAACCPRAAAHRPQRGGGRRGRADARRRDGRRHGRAPALRMELVSNLTDIKEGDSIVASGVDGIYRGVHDRTGGAVGAGSGLYRSVTVRPTVDFSNLEEVLVVLVPPRPATRDEGGA